MEFINKNKWLILGAVLLFVLGLATGRYATPPDKITKIETVEIEKIVYVKEQEKTEQNKTYKHTIEKTLPDGTVTKETTETDEKNLFVKEKEQSQEERASSNTEEKLVGVTNKGRWLINGMIGADVSAGIEGQVKEILVYGIQVDYRILGPIHVGAWGVTSKEVGLSVGLEF